MACNIVHAAALSRGSMVRGSSAVLPWPFSFSKVILAFPVHQDTGTTSRSSLSGPSPAVGLLIKCHYRRMLLSHGSDSEILCKRLG